MPRNPSIANAFFRAGMVEGWGRGYEKVLEACEAAGANLPIVEADFGGLMVCVRESNKYRELRLSDARLLQPDKTNETINETINERINERIKPTDAQILAFIGKNNYTTINELMALTGKSRATVTRSVRNMIETGMIERIGSRKSGHWRIIKREEQ